MARCDNNKFDCPICATVGCAPSAKFACPSCDFVTCKPCQKTFLRPNCMNCGVSLSRGFLIATLGKTWVNGPLREHEQEELMARETTLLRHTMDEVQRERARRQFRDRARFGRAALAVLERAQRANGIGAGASDSSRQAALPGHQFDPRKSVLPCPASGCKGFVVSGRCGICGMLVCMKCLKGVGRDDGGQQQQGTRALPHMTHVCAPEDVASVDMLRRDSVPCPQCCALVHKTEGCNHMYCTNCGAYWDWATRKLMRANTNTHYRHVQAFARDVARRVAPTTLEEGIEGAGVTSSVERSSGEGAAAEASTSHASRSSGNAACIAPDPLFLEEDDDETRATRTSEDAVPADVARGWIDDRVRRLTTMLYEGGTNSARCSGSGNSNSSSSSSNVRSVHARVSPYVDALFVMLFEDVTVIRFAAQKRYSVRLAENAHRQATLRARTAFLMDEIDEPTWRRRVYSAENAFHRDAHVARVLELYLLTIRDFQRRLLHAVRQAPLPDREFAHHDACAEDVHAEFREFVRLCNEGLASLREEFGGPRITIRDDAHDADIPPLTVT